MSRLAPIARIAAGTRLLVGSLGFALLSACGGGGDSTPPPAPLAVTISVAPASVVAGQSATLTWSSVTGATCTASGGWSGAQPASGTTTVTTSSAGTITYSLSCTAAGGIYTTGSTGSGSAALTVTAPTGYTTTILVSDTAAGGGLVVDPSLVNPWGVAWGATSPVWVANNHAQNSTLYDGNGKAQPTASPIVAHLANNATTGATFDPTGVVVNTTTGFTVTNGTTTAAARFTFSGEGGMLAGWSATTGAANAINTFSGTNGEVYKGLAIAVNGTATYLYAADFHNNKVDVFDSTWARQASSATSFSFTDPTLPAGYAPFGIQALPTGASGAAQIWVAYAKQAAPGNTENVNGAGLGLVDVYDTNGAFIRRVVPAGDKLNAPWGLALAPANFGTLSNALLVGNFGDGRIYGFDPTTGAYIGTVVDNAGVPFAKPGLWGIGFGNNAGNQPKTTLFFAAGTNNELNGIYGRIDLGGAPLLNQPPVVTITAPTTQGVSGTVAVTATATAQVNIAKVQFFANGTLIGTATTSPYTVQWDTSTVPNATGVALTATATDVDGNVGSSAAYNVTAGTMALSALQASIFTTKCAVCHNGVGTTLPGVQNLNDGATFTSVVNVASLEVGTLKRVLPGDANNSYLIQKLEGTASVGARMPLGGPYLDQATINQVRTWINNGAPNN